MDMIKKAVVDLYDSYDNIPDNSKAFIEKIIEKPLTNQKNLAIILNCIIIACSMGFYCQCDKIHSYFWRNLCKKDNKKDVIARKGYQLL
mgnify:CR=1 FL=1